jgi:hypothetical protein
MLRIRICLHWKQGLKYILVYPQRCELKRDSEPNGRGMMGSQKAQNGGIRIRITTRKKPRPGRVGGGPLTLTNSWGQGAPDISPVSTVLRQCHEILNWPLLTRMQHLAPWNDKIPYQVAKKKTRRQCITGIWTISWEMPIDYRYLWNNLAPAHFLERFTKNEEKDGKGGAPKTQFGRSARQN